LDCHCHTVQRDVWMFRSWACLLCVRTGTCVSCSLSAGASVALAGGVATARSWRAGWACSRGIVLAGARAQPACGARLAGGAAAQRRCSAQLGRVLQIEAARLASAQPREDKPQRSRGGGSAFGDGTGGAAQRHSSVARGRPAASIRPTGPHLASCVWTGEARADVSAKAAPVSSCGRADGRGGAAGHAAAARALGRLQRSIYPSV